MKSEKTIVMTSFELPRSLRIQLKVMCMLTNTSMAEFIRTAVREKIIHLKKSNISLEV